MLEIPDDVQALVTGEVASIGSLSGRLALSSESAGTLKGQKGLVSLVRPETRTEDLEGIIKSDGIVTARGGRTSHAAVVARHLGKACITGCSRLEIDEDRHEVRVGSTHLREGDWISMDGRTGNVYPGHFESRLQEEDPVVEKARRWARELGQDDHPLLQGEARP